MYFKQIESNLKAKEAHNATHKKLAEGRMKDVRKKAARIRRAKKSLA